MKMEANGSEWWSGETVAVVTGANRGLGLEICRQLADKGLTVIMTARKPQEQLSSSAKQYLQEVEEMGRKNVIFHTLDIDQEQSVLDFVDWLKQHVGNIDILVNNAGILTADVDFELLKHKVDDIRTFLEVNGSEWWSGETVAVVTGANRGLGLEIRRQLADKGLTVIMTARKPQEQLSSSAKQYLQEVEEMGRKNVIFHTLDIDQEQSVLDFVDWLKQHVGNIDILVNNAGIPTPDVDWEFMKQNHVDIRTSLEKIDCGRGTSVPYELAKQCIDTNYYGTKKLTDALLPFLRPSPYKARIVMVSSIAGLLYYVRDEELRKQLSETEGLTEHKIDGVFSWRTSSLRRPWRSGRSTFLLTPFPKLP